MSKTEDTKGAAALEDPGPRVAKNEAYPDGAGNPDNWHIVPDYKEPGLKGVLHRIGMGITGFLSRLIYGKPVLTPAGKCFLNYCRAIVEGTQRPEERIYAYEEQLRRVITVFRNKDGEPPKYVPREVLARTVVYCMSDMETDA